VLLNRTIIGDCVQVLDTLPERTFRTCVTSPPFYRQREYPIPPTAWPAVDYAPMPGLPVVHVPAMTCQLGMEPNPTAYVGHLLLAMRAVRRVLTNDGTLWIELGDSYYGQGGGAAGQSAVLNGRAVTDSGARVRKVGHSRVAGLKRKDLIGIPWRAAFALQADRWWLRAEIIWHKPSVTPESVKDRPTRAHSHVLLLSKRKRYHFDEKAIREPVTGNAHPRGKGVSSRTPLPGLGIKANTSFGAAVRDLVDDRHARSVWTIYTVPYEGEHFSPFPRQIPQRCIMAGSKLGDAVLDPFIGSGTVGQVAESLGRHWLGIDLSYADLSAERTAQAGLRFAGDGVK
jgi:DNA modification methylase